jgi:hypothetical protein
MSIENKLKTLIDKEINKSKSLKESVNVNDFESMSDEELCREAESAGAEESIVKDGEGNLTDESRSEIINILSNLENSEDDINEAEDDEKESDDEDSEKESEDDLEVDPESESEEGSEEDEPEEDSETEEKITVVVVSPELKKDEAEDDDLDSSYEIEDKLIDTKTHMEALSQGETLSEDFKEKIKLIFEAAMAEQIKSVRNKFVKEFKLRESKIKSQFDKQVKDLKESLIKEQAVLVDGYLSEAVDKWIVENSVVLESNVRTELTEEFIDGLKNLFAEHYIEVPQEKFDLVKAQEEKIKQLEESVKLLKHKTVKALKESKKLHCESVLNKATSNMTELDKAKFIKLVESVEFDSIDQFEKKVKTLKESYMVKSKSENSKVLSENRINRPKKIMQEVRTEDDTKKINSPQDALVSFLDDIL